MTGLTDDKIIWDELKSEVEQLQQITKNIPRNNAPSTTKKTSLKSEIERLVRAGHNLDIYIILTSDGVMNYIITLDNNNLKTHITDKPVKYLRSIP